MLTPARSGSGLCLELVRRRPAPRPALGSHGPVRSDGASDGLARLLCSGLHRQPPEVMAEELALRSSCRRGGRRARGCPGPGRVSRSPGRPRGRPRSPACSCSAPAGESPCPGSHRPGKCAGGTCGGLASFTGSRLSFSRLTLGPAGGARHRLNPTGAVKLRH